MTNSTPDWQALAGEAQVQLGAARGERDAAIRDLDEVTRLWQAQAGEWRVRAESAEEEVTRLRGDLDEWKGYARARGEEVIALRAAAVGLVGDTASGASVPELSACLIEAAAAREIAAKRETEHLKLIAQLRGRVSREETTEPAYVRAYHFVGHRLSPFQPIPADGDWLAHAEPVQVCAASLCAYLDPYDALVNAEGATLCLVEMAGEFLAVPGRVVASRRRIVARIDATALLRLYARQCAQDVLPLWDAPAVVAEYLATGEETLRARASSAAWLAAEDHRGDTARMALDAASWAASHPLFAWMAVKAAKASAAAERARGDDPAEVMGRQRARLRALVDAAFGAVAGDIDCDHQTAVRERDALFAAIDSASAHLANTYAGADAHVDAAVAVLRAAHDAHEETHMTPDEMMMVMQQTIDDLREEVGDLTVNNDETARVWAAQAAGWRARAQAAEEEVTRLQAAEEEVTRLRAAEEEVTRLREALEQARAYISGGSEWPSARATLDLIVAALTGKDGA